MAAKRSSPASFLGQPWSSWTDFLGQVTPKEDPDGKPCSYKTPATAMKLPRRDMDLFGFCPERDQFTVVVCETCRAVVKPQCLKSHIALRHSAESVKRPPTSPLLKKTPAKTFKSLLKNGKVSKVRVKKPASVIIAKADSTTKPVLVNIDIINNHNNLAVASTSNVMDTTVEMAVVSSTTNTGKPVTGIVTNMLANGITNNLITNGMIGITPSALILSPPATEAMDVDDSESPVSSISLPVTPMEIDEKISSDSLKNGELQPVVALSPLVNKPNSPATLILTKPLSAVMPLTPVSPAPQVSVTSPPNNIPPVVPAITVPAQSLPTNAAKPRRIIRAERKSLSMKEKEYNADKHCGVVVGDSKPCTRSLTCRLHSMPKRRAVEGRSKTFDQLLADHRATKEAVLRQKKTSDSNYSQNTSTMAVLNLQVSEAVNTISESNTVARVSVTSLHASGSGGGGCGPPEMGIRLPNAHSVSLLSPGKIQATPTHGSCTSELLSATPLDTTSNSPLSSVNMSVSSSPYLSPRVNLQSFNKLIEPPEAATPNISTAVDITFTRAHPKPLTLSLFSAHKIGGLIYRNKKFRMARHFVKDLEDLY